MKTKEKLLQEFAVLNEKELIYKKYYEVKDDPQAKERFLKEYEDYVRKNYLLIFDYPFIVYPKILREEDLYKHLSITKGSNVNIVRHLRYTPVFTHSHTFFTVLYVLKGHCGHTAGDLDLPMEEGDVFFLPPYEKQTISVFDDSIVLNIHIRRDTFGDYFFNVLRGNSILSEFFVSSLYSKDPVKGIMFHTQGNKEIKDLFLDMCLEVEEDDRYSWRLLDNMVPILFAKLLRGFSDTVEMVGNEKDEFDEKRLQILSYISNHYNSITLEDVAEHFHYSVPYCSKLIQSEAGMNFVSFVRQIRMNHATAMLRNSNMPVAEISYMIGYENTESFIRAFKKVYDMSPSAYRKRNSLS